MAMAKRERLADFEIDKLTNSIENFRTRETFDTEINQLKIKNAKLVSKKDWLFDWKSEIGDKSKEVFKLSTVNNPSVIQGLISIEEKLDHIFMHLVESASFNRGKEKMYLGVPGNLVAFACKISSERGHEGFVAFDSKTVLINYYRETLGAIQLRGQRMYLDDKAAQKLIYQYFKK
jgi:hypothetical protein